jgi:capsular polysaccharide biosynthesis protein
MLPGPPPPYIVEMIAILGLTGKIRFEPSEPITYARLTVPSYCASGDGYIPSDLVNFLRNNLARNVPLERDKRKLFISRKNAGWRRILNEPNVESLLKKANFKTLRLEEMSVKEQITEFTNASIVIAPHGAGLTNLIYSQEGTKVLEFFSESYVNKCYVELAGESMLDYYYAVFKAPEQSPKDMFLDLALLEQFL